MGKHLRQSPITYKLCISHLLYKLQTCQDRRVSVQTKNFLTPTQISISILWLRNSCAVHLRWHPNESTCVWRNELHVQCGGGSRYFPAIFYFGHMCNVCAFMICIKKDSFSLSLYSPFEWRSLCRCFSVCGERDCIWMRMVHWGHISINYLHLVML